uniref:Uncharacterized protein n=1 Tax=Candidatus Nitrotoga fabula TaxID=2182327 RepID=A0A2X0QSX1_9PROT|nr:conserved protein of unknown function [Candidatus Nitrotoga fabula]
MSDARKIFVSYKYKDMDVYPLEEYTPGDDTGYMYTPRHYVDKIIEVIGSEHIYKGEKSNEDASHLSDTTIHSMLKNKIFDSSITVVLLSPNMIDPYVPESEQWIPNEISYSLRVIARGDRKSGTNGLLLVALPDRNGSYDYAVVHQQCGVRSWQTESFFSIIRKNMFNRLNKNHTLCQSCFCYHHHDWDHSYAHPVKWEDFIDDYNTYIDRAVALMEAKHEFDIVKTHD